MIFRGLVTDEEIKRDTLLVDGSVALKSSLRKLSGALMLHASVSCKLPHIVVVTGEPMPMRLSFRPSGIAGDSKGIGTGRFGGSTEDYGERKSPEGYLRSSA